MPDFEMTFVAPQLQSYRLYPSADGDWLGLSMVIAGQEILVSIPRESLGQLLRGIESNLALLEERKNTFCPQ